MDISSYLASLLDPIQQSFVQIYHNSLRYLPQIITALALGIAGLMLAYSMQFLVGKLVSNLDNLFNRIGGSKQPYIQQSYVYIIGKTVFWCVFLLFLDAASTILGWQLLSEWTHQLIIYLPHVITSLLMILAGYLLSLFCKNFLNRTFPSQQTTRNLLLSTLVQWSIMFIIILLALQQLGIDVTVLMHLIIVMTGIILGGGALAFSLGARTLTANIIGAQYAKKHCRIGDLITIADTTGELLDITQIALIIETHDGIVVVPAKLFQDEVSATLKQTAGN